MKEKMKANQITREKKQRIKKIETEKGITLLALVITIIVLLILAGITIGAITGDSGILQNAIEAKEKTEIANEREIVEEATVRAMGNNKRGNLVRDELQKELDKLTGEGKTIVTTDTEEQGYFVKFVDSRRIYKVSIDGEVEYLGKEDELITQADIIADPESNTTPEFLQEVGLTVKTPIEIEGAEYLLVYAWNQDKENAPEDEKFLEANLIGQGRIRTTTVYSSDTAGGDYYLWVRIVVGEIEREECFGPYAIKDHTTLVATSSEIASTSGFLGSANQEKELVKEVQRGLIKSVNIVTSLEGHSLNDANTWDVSDGNKGMYLAWVEKDENGYYGITIGGEGSVVARNYSTCLFKNIGYGVENQEVTITGLENLDTGLVIDMVDMFRNCQVSNLDLNGFDTSNVRNMGNMFYACNVSGLNLNDFDTSNVTNMSGMFYDCSSLTNLNIDNFDTSNVTNMNGMFHGCGKLTNLNVSSFNTKNVVNMNQMFDYCRSLIQLDLNNFDTSNVTNMTYMFYNCTKLVDLKIDNFDTSKVTSMGRMFWWCSSLKSLDVSSFNTSNVTSMERMFANCTTLTQLDVSNLRTDNVKSMNAMFGGSSGLISLDLTNFKTENVTDMQSMFDGCSNLISLKVSSFNTNNVKVMSGMFNNCAKLKNLDLSNFNTSNITNMELMFGGCHSLTDLNISSFDTSNVTSMFRTFINCSSLTELDLSNFYIGNVTNMESMFHGCGKLTRLDIRNFDISKVTNSYLTIYLIPTTIEIITNQNTKDWILEKFPDYTNITVVE